MNFDLMILPSPETVIVLIGAIITGLFAISENRKIFLAEKTDTKKLLWGAFCWAVFFIYINGLVKNRHQGWGLLAILLTTLFYFNAFFLKKNLKWTATQFASFISIIILVPTVILPFMISDVLIPIAKDLFSHKAIVSLLMITDPLVAAGLTVSVLAIPVAISQHRKLGRMANVHSKTLLSLAYLWGMTCGGISMVFEQRLATYSPLFLVTIFYSYLVFLKKSLRWRGKQFILFILSMVAIFMAFSLLMGLIADWREWHEKAQT